MPIERQCIAFIASMVGSSGIVARGHSVGNALRGKMVASVFGLPPDDFTSAHAHPAVPFP